MAVSSSQSMGSASPPEPTMVAQEGELAGRGEKRSAKAEQMRMASMGRSDVKVASRRARTSSFRPTYKLDLRGMRELGHLSQARGV